MMTSTSSSSRGGPACSAWRVIRRSLASVAVLVAMCAAVALNVVVARHDTHLDMTSSRLYTLSAASTRVIEESEAPIHVEIFLSDALPPPLHTTRERLEDLLDEYVAASSGKLSYTFRTPQQGDEEPERKGCRAAAIGQRTIDSLSVRSVYRCLVFTQGERTHVVPDLRLTGQAELDNLELDVTRGLLTLTRTSARTVGLVMGLGGPADVPGFVETAAGVFDELYGGAIMPIALDFSTPNPTIAHDVDAVIILNIHGVINEVGRFELDQHMRRGGAIGWFQSASVPDEKLIRQLASSLGKAEHMPAVYRPAHTGLDELMAFYGVTHRHDIVVDAEHAVEAVVWTSKGFTQAKNPAIFQVDALDRKLPFLRHTSVMVWSVPSSLEVDEEALRRQGIDVRRAVRTSSDAVRIAEPLRTRTYESVMSASAGVQGGPFTLVAALEGAFPSYYATHPLPPGVNASDVEGGVRPGRLLVMGSGDFILPAPTFGYDEQSAAQGQQLFFQSIEWLVQDHALAEIRDRRTPEFLASVSAETRWRVQCVNIVCVPACFLLVGYGMLLRRRRRRERLQPAATGSPSS